MTTLACSTNVDVRCGTSDAPQYAIVGTAFSGSPSPPGLQYNVDVTSFSAGGRKRENYNFNKEAPKEEGAGGSWGG